MREKKERSAFSLVYGKNVCFFAAILLSLIISEVFFAWRNVQHEEERMETELSRQGRVMADTLDTG